MALRLTICKSVVSSYGRPPWLGDTRSDRTSNDLQTLARVLAHTTRRAADASGGGEYVIPLVGEPRLSSSPARTPKQRDPRYSCNSEIVLEPHRQ